MFIQGQTNLGWTCPRCNNCYSPTTSQCVNCNQNYTETTETTGRFQLICTCGQSSGVCLLHRYKVTYTSDGTTVEDPGNITNLEGILYEDDDDIDITITESSWEDMDGPKGLWKSTFNTQVQQQIDLSLEALTNPDLSEVKDKYRQSVKDFASKNDAIPQEIKDMSGVPSAVLKTDCGCKCTEGPCPKEAK